MDQRRPPPSGEETIVTVAAILSLPPTSRMRTYDSSPPPPAPPPSPTEDADVHVLYSGSEGDTAATTVLTPTTSTATVPSTMKPVASFNALFRDTAGAITRLPAAARQLTYDSAAPNSATALSPDQKAGDIILGGEVAVNTNMRPPSKA